MTGRASPLRLAAVALLAAAAAACGGAPAATVAPSPVAADAPRWWKGNTHTHTLWSDGDHFPELVVAWYREQGYHFLAVTDHNTLADTVTWWRVPRQGPGAEAYRKYREAMGDSVEERRAGDTVLVRLRRTDEYRRRYEEPGRFVLVPGEEVTQYLERKGAHVNVLNLAEAIPEQRGATLVEIIRADLARVREQERRTGRELVAVLNHPNFVWSQTAEDIVALPELRFFEVYNGHPLVNVLGDSLHAGNERIWDIVLTRRLSAGASAADGASGGGMLFGVATDDAHDYHAFAPDRRNPGRGWIMVRAPALEPAALMAAMKRGDFYASTGVALDEVRRDGARLSLAIRGEPGVTYTTQFVGTRRGWDTTSVEVRDAEGVALTRRYGRDVGAVLAEVPGTSPAYAMRGDELYVRARVVSSRAKLNPSYAGEVEMAWTQPVRPRDLALHDLHMRRVVEPGTVTPWVGGSAAGDARHASASPAR